MEKEECLLIFKKYLTRALAVVLVGSILLPANFAHAQSEEEKQKVIQYLVDKGEFQIEGSDVEVIVDYGVFRTDRTVKTPAGYITTKDTTFWEYLWNLDVSIRENNLKTYTTHPKPTTFKFVRKGNLEVQIIKNEYRPYR